MVDKTLEEVYESDPLALASAYGVEVVDPEETVEAAKDAAQFTWESLPGVGTYYTVEDIKNELRQEKPNYLKIGALAGTEVIGLVPGLGGAAKNMIRQGAKFKTKRGSVYTVEDQSRTTRERAPDTPGGEFVKQPTSGKTVYMSYEDMERFGPLFQKGEPELYQFVPTGKDKAQLVFTQDYGPYKAGDAVPNTEVSYTLEPQLGLNPVEIYDSTNKNKRSIHFGNEIIEVESDIPKVPRGTSGSNLVDREADALEAARLRNDPDALEQWRKENKLPETQRQKNIPEAEAAAQALIEGSITSKEARKRIQEAFPEPREYTPEEVMNLLPTLTEVQGALGKKGTRYPILGVEGADLAEGQVVSSRLDIPAYDDYDKWVVSIHDGNQKSGSVVGYGQAIRLKNIRFGSDADTALDIARGIRTSKATGQDAIDKKTGEAAKQNKATIARIFGEYTSEDPYDLQRQAAEIIASGSDEWTQVGMNPYRKSAFYNKKTGMPVFEADEIIQVGPLVLAKNVKKPTASQLREMAVKTKDGKVRMFNEGGMAMDEQMNAVFKSSRTGYAAGGTVDLDTVPDNTVGVDPVSGNEIPLGSTAENVRDDIPAQLSEGEYVVPADVVRYYGVKFFEDLRADAKFGYQDMQENGRIGGDPVGMEMGQDELPFDINELQVTDEPVEMAEGGLTPNTYGGTMYGGSGVEYIEYTDGTRTMLIPFFNGVPMAVIPEGFYAGSPKTAAEEAVAPSNNDDDGGPEMPAPEAIDYANLTTDELVEMVEQQTTFGMDDGVSALLGALNPLAGLFMKGAMMHQAKLTKKELERRVAAEDISDEERARLQSLIEVTEQPNFMQGILGKIKGAFEKDKEPEIPTIDKQSVTDAVTEAMMYDPTAKSATEESNITTSELAPIVTPTNKAGEMPTPYRATVDGPNVAAMRKTYTGMENVQPDVDFADPTMVPDASPKPNETENLRMRRAGERAGETVTGKTKARMIRRESEKRGKSIAEIGRAVAPSNEDRSPDYSDPRRGGAPKPTTRRTGGGGGGRNKGGLASKKKK